MPRTVSINDATFNVLDEGSGPPLLLVHGFPLDHTMWRHQIEEFKQTHRVIAPDLRGFGQSPLPSENAATPNTVAMRQHADDLAAILPMIGENRPVILCGLSMGGYVAWQFVEHHRSKLAALIVCDTKAAGDTPEAKQARTESAEKLEREGTAFLSDTLLPKLFGEQLMKNPPPYVQETAAIVLRSDPRACAAAQRGMAERDDYRSKLANIDVHTLVLCGEKDVISPPQEMQDIANAIPRATYVEIPGASHMAPLEMPVPVNAAISEFLAKL